MVTHRFWLFIASTVVLFALALVSGSASAAPKAFSTQIVKGDVEWTIPADQCAALPAGVALNATGRRYAVITTKTKGDGSQVITNNDFVTGTATDNDSGTYTWIYSNQAREQIPAGGGEIQVNMTDTFILHQTNGETDMTVGFKWKWTYTPPEEIWPPVHNWNQQITIGDAFTCDPI